MTKKYLICTSIILIRGEDLKSFLVKKGGREILFEFDTTDEMNKALSILNQTKKPTLVKDLISKETDKTKPLEKLINRFLDLKILVDFDELNHTKIVVNNEFDQALDNYLFGKELSLLDFSSCKEKMAVRIVGFNNLGVLLADIFREMGFSDTVLVDYTYLKNKRLDGDKKKLFKFDQFLTLDNKESLIIVADELGNIPALRHLNHIFCQKRWNFLSLFVLSEIGYAGPWVIPGKTSCLDCLFSRMEETGTELNLLNASEEEFFEWQNQLVVHPSILATLAHLFTFQLTAELSLIMKNYSNDKKTHTFANYCNALMEVDLSTPKIFKRSMIRKINCPACLEIRNKQKQIFDFSSEEFVS